jgi:hypothetical protein
MKCFAAVAMLLVAGSALADVGGAQNHQQQAQHQYADARDSFRSSSDIVTSGGWESPSYAAPAYQSKLNKNPNT